MYYKVIKDNKVIDVLDHLVFVRYQEDSKIMIVCARNMAQAIMSSDCNYIWHASGLQEIPVSGYDTVEVVPINQYEYKQLKALNMKTPEEIIDAYTLLLLEDNVL